MMVMCDGDGYNDDDIKWMIVRYEIDDDNNNDCEIMDTKLMMMMMMMMVMVIVMGIRYVMMIM